VGQNNAVVRFPYRAGDMQAGGPAQTVVPRPAPQSGGHWTRDIGFSPDGRQMYVSVGSGSNVATNLPRVVPEAIRALEARNGMGAVSGDEELRASVLTFDPEGGAGRVFTTGLRNCSGLAVYPRTGDVWCATNERDGLGDDLPPDFVTRVHEGTFYGWPWFYIGNHEDPRHRDARPDLATKVARPDIVLEAHAAPLGIAFYDGSGPASFPPEYRGDALVTMHGSWNRARRVGFKVVRVPLHDGVPQGFYDDFLTGFVLDDDRVWGRPVGVAVAHDGALLIGEDGNGTIWRTAYTGQTAR